MALIWNLLLLSISIFIVAQVLPTIRIRNFGTTVIVAVVYSLVNFFLGWLLVFLAFPALIVTFGLFHFIINAAMLWITDQMVEDFEIDGFGATVVAAFLITVLNAILRWLF